MRVINVRLVVIWVLAAAVLGGIVHVVHGYQVRRHAEVFLREADRSQDRNKPYEAINYLQRYVTLVPQDTDGLEKLGTLQADVGWLDQAFMTLEQVLRRDPGRSEARRRLVNVALRRGRYNDAREHLEKHLLKRFPEDGELWTLLGRCQTATRQSEQAVESLNRGLKIAPDIKPGETIPDWVLSASHLRADLLLTQLDHAQQAVLSLDDVVSKYANAADADRVYVLRGRFWNDRLAEAVRRDHVTVDGLDPTDPVSSVRIKALQDAERALALAPDQLETLLFAAQCALANRQYDQAREYGRRGLELSPQNDVVYATLADVELKDGHPDEAIRWLQRGLKALPDQDGLRWNLANLMIENGKLERAGAIIDELGTGEFPKARVRYLRGRVLFEQQQWLAAAHLFEDVRGPLAQTPDLVKLVDFWLGQCYEQLGSSDQQLLAFRRAVDADPFWIPARLGVASALISVGRTDEALQEYRQIARLPDSPGFAWAYVARLMILSNLRRERAPRNPPELWAPVEAVLDRAVQADPDSPYIPIFRAEILVAQDRVAEAQQHLVAARDKAPSQQELWLALVALDRRERQWDHVEELLNQANKQLGDSPKLRLEKARYLVQRFGEEARQQIRELADNTDNFTDEEQRELDDGLATFALNIQDFELAERLAKNVADREPNNLRIRLLLFDLAFRSERIEAMQQVLEEVGRIEGRGPLWQYGEAVRLSVLAKRVDPAAPDRRQTKTGREELYAKAQQHLSEAALARPAWSRIPLLSGQIYELQGKEDAALEAYLQAIELGERQPKLINRTVRLLFDRQRFVEADRLIGRLQEQQTPFSADLTRLATRISLRLEDFDRALELAQKAAEDSTDYRDQIWLGQVLSLNPQHYEQAEQTLRYAVKLAEDTPEPWVALIQFFARIGQTTQAEAAIAEASRTLGASEALPAGHAPLAIAQCYESIDQRDQAEQQYHAALASASDDPQVVVGVTRFFLRSGDTKEADAQLKRIVDGDIPVETADLRWARRSLALLLAARGGEDNLRRAQSVLAPNLSDSPDPTDRRAKAVVLAMQPGTKSRQEAIRILEGLLSNRLSASPADEFILARLYLAEDNWSKANDHLRSLAASAKDDPSYPAYVSTYIQALIEHGELGEADLWLDRLEQLAPDVLSTSALRARALFAEKHYDQTLEELKQFAAASPKGDATDSAAQWSQVARQLEHYSRQLRDAGEAGAAADFAEEAEKIYRQFLRDDPSNAMRLAGFLGRQGRGDAAADVIIENWPQADSTRLATACASAIQNSQTEPGSLRKIETVLHSAIEQRDRPVSLLLVLAELYSWQQRDDEAESVYRELLDRDERNVPALNNLALKRALIDKDVAGALKLIEGAIAVAGENGALLDSRAVIRLVGGDPQQALLDLDEAVAQQPTVSRLFHRAQANHQLRRNRAARQDFQQALELGLDPQRLYPPERKAFYDLKAALEVPGPA